MTFRRKPFRRRDNSSSMTIRQIRHLVEIKS